MNSDFFLKMLGNKEQVIQQILEDIDQCQVISKELSSAIDVAEAGSDEDLRKTVKFLAKSQQRLITSILRLGIVSLVYVQSDSFGADNARLLVKLGRGKEAIREFARSKFGKASG